MSENTEKNEVQTISPLAAKSILDSEPKCLLVDVRSHMEFLFIGHPVGAVHIPWIDEPDWDINPNFVREIRQLLLGGMAHDGHGKQVPVLLICRSGKRSKEAGDLLIQEGFVNVYNIDLGFEGELDNEHHRSTTGGWRHEGLPWEQC
ncbi:Rhodanese-related sulfurtransferase [hydrothermal vent metagenome]|uniref:Rhodanese-related sulfurtransferase n=1 Tax=hydrothermal vent metagenome TaxID=652676 RepID=A0A3B1AEN4_9ZZZZ